MIMKGLRNAFLALTAVAFVAVGCNNGGQEEVYKPIEGETNAKVVSNSPDVNAKVEGYDPLKKQKEKQQQQESTSNLPATNIAFPEYDWDFGTIDEGDRVEHIFKFTNTGSEPLVLENCKGSCGCTVPECPKTPVQPGEDGEIKVVFNSKGKKNKQTKKVTVTANTEPAQTILTIRAEVTPEGEGGSPMK